MPRRSLTRAGPLGRVTASRPGGSTPRSSLSSAAAGGISLHCDSSRHTRCVVHADVVVGAGDGEGVAEGGSRIQVSRVEGLWSTTPRARDGVLGAAVGPRDGRTERNGNGLRVEEIIAHHDACVAC